MGTAKQDTAAPDASPSRWTPKRVRCDNCPKFVLQYRPWQRFCSAKCRREFQRNGAGFGQLKERIPKMVAKEVARQILETFTVEGIAAVQAAAEKRRARAAAEALTKK
jgi:hypothetical protein